MKNTEYSTPTNEFKTVCKHCGGHINSQTKKCMVCGKHSKIGKQHLRNIFIGVLIFSLLASNIVLGVICYKSYNDKNYYYNMYQANLQGKQEYYNLYHKARSENSQSSEEISSLYEEIDELKDQISDLEERNQEQAQHISDLVTAPTQPVIVHDSNATAVKKSGSCIIPSCNRTAARNSFYCYAHKCLTPGCNEKKANDFSTHCIIHS